MDTTAASFKITLDGIVSEAIAAGLLPAGAALEYRHNGAGHAPYVYGGGGDTQLGTLPFLPEFTARYTRRESMAALEATERALRAANVNTRRRGIERIAGDDIGEGGRQYLKAQDEERRYMEGEDIQ